MTTTGGSLSDEVHGVLAVGLGLGGCLCRTRRMLIRLCYRTGGRRRTTALLRVVPCRRRNGVLGRHTGRRQCVFIKNYLGCTQCVVLSWLNNDLVPVWRRGRRQRRRHIRRHIRRGISAGNRNGLRRSFALCCCRRGGRRCCGRLLLFVLLPLLSLLLLGLL